jgi:hypothetical protein
MNNTIQTLLRSLLKIGAGYLISKGLIDDSHAEEGIAAALGLAAIIWGVFHRTPKAVAQDGAAAEAVPVRSQSTLPLIAILLPLLWACAISGLTGCGTLDPNGAYKGDKVLYVADRTIRAGRDLLHEFVKWEFENRVALAKSPEITAEADYVRGHARKWISTAVRMREAYSTEPSAENRTALEVTLDVLRQAMADASSYMAKGKTQAAIGDLQIYKFTNWQSPDAEPWRRSRAFAPLSLIPV